MPSQSLLVFLSTPKDLPIFPVILPNRYLKLYVNLAVHPGDDINNLRYINELFGFGFSVLYLNIFAYSKHVVMEKLDIFRIIVDIIAVIIAGGWLVRILTVKSRVKQGKAEADKTVEEAKNAQIENVRKMIDEVYQSTINSLKNDIKDLRDDVSAVKDENEALKKEVAELRDENSRLRKENEELRDAVREIRPDVVPSRRSINAQNQNRNEKGQFAKVEE